MSELKAGDYVLVRSRDAGVHAGELVSARIEGSLCEVRLKKSRRLWYWWAAKAAFLSGVARYGINHEKSKIGGEIDVSIYGACEVIPCTPEAAKSIGSAPEYMPS